MNKTAKEQKYRNHLKIMENKWEDLCIRCGGCCGAHDDPCHHLKKDKSGKYSCSIYPERLGERVTVSGEKFDCVLLRKIIHTYWKNDCLCVYKKALKMPWLLEEGQ